MLQIIANSLTDKLEKAGAIAPERRAIVAQLSRQKSKIFIMN